MPCVAQDRRRLGIARDPHRDAGQLAGTAAMLSDGIGDYGRLHLL
jgi:hypothetical protein